MTDLDDGPEPINPSATREEERGGPSPSPIKTLRLFRRCVLGRKHFFAAPDSDDAQYFINNPVPHKHARKWKPIFYRGDNPKYMGTSKAIARARRTAIWSSFRIELGDGVEEVLENKRRMQEQKRHERRLRWRRAFCMREKPPKKPLEEVKEVKGLVMTVKMRRRGFLNRTLTWEWAGQEYRWSGTRRFLPGWSSRLKGMSHDMKLVNSSGDLVATFEKDRWVSYKPSETMDGGPNKNRSFVGNLFVYPAGQRTTKMDMQRHNSAGIRSKVDDVDHKLSGNKGKLDENVNLEGAHVGNLTEEAIAFTCWMIIEGEHRLRYKILDVIAEIAENLGE